MTRKNFPLFISVSILISSLFFLILIKFVSSQRENFQTLQTEIDALKLESNAVQELKDRLVLRRDVLMLKKDKISMQSSVYMNFFQILGGAAIFLTTYLGYRSFRVAEGKQVTESFAKAIEYLGSKEVEIRLGGIYILEEVANKYPEYHWKIMETLSAFVREKTLKVSGPKDPPGVDVRAALTVIGRRQSIYDADHLFLKGNSIDLRKVDLQQIEFDKRARLNRVDFSGSVLSGAGLQGVLLANVNFTGADLRGANLSGANLHSAKLADADLDGAELRKCRNLTNKQIKEACNWEKAQYAPGKLEELLHDKDSDP